MTEQTLGNTGAFANELQLLEAVGATPETSQADLAAQIGVAVGTVNWYLKRWSKKGYVKIKRIGRWKWEYLLTPEGVARKAILASQYLEASMSIYRRTRSEAKYYLEQVQKAGYERVGINDDSEIAEICRLTCLELGVEVASFDGIESNSNQNLPIFDVDGLDLVLIWPKRHSSG